MEIIFQMLENVRIFKLDKIQNYDIEECAVTHLVSTSYARGRAPLVTRSASMSYVLYSRCYQLLDSGQKKTPADGAGENC